MNRDGFEYMVLKVTAGNKVTVVAVIYNPPGNSSRTGDGMIARREE